MPLSARILVLSARHGWPPASITRLSEDIDYRVVGIPDAVSLRLHPVSSPAEIVTVQLLAIEPAASPGSPGKQARTELAAWLFHRTVTLQLDRRQIDDDGNLLAYVFRHEECVNEWLVQAGHCRVRAQPSDFPSIVRRLQAAEATARQDRRGAWQHVALRE